MFPHRTLSILVAAGLTLAEFFSVARAQNASPAPIAVDVGWIMQDATHVKGKEEALSKVGFAPDIYKPTPYVAPLTASADMEVGSVSIPTLEVIQSWMPEKDWFDINFRNDDWAEHDLVMGNGSPVASPFHVTLTALVFGPP